MRSPYSFSWSALGLVVSHSENSLSLQKLHEPHAISKASTTRSPFLMFFTAGPTSSTMPMNCNRSVYVNEADADVSYCNSEDVAVH